MNKILLAASALVSLSLLAPAAHAADVAAPAVYDWSGFYVGLNAGIAWNNTEIDNDIKYDGLDEPPPWLDDVGNDLTGDDSVFTGGALIGYNWQMDSLVLGVEADINYLGFSGDASHDRDLGGVDPEVLSFAAVPDKEQPHLNSTHDLSFDADWFGTLRGRVGFAADNFLFYGTGGLAYGHLQAESDFRLYDHGTELGRWKSSVDDINWGWTIGAGMEYGIDNWSLGVEYLFVDLGEADWESDGDNLKFSDFRSEGSVDYQFSVVRASAKLRF